MKTDLKLKVQEPSNSDRSAAKTEVLDASCRGRYDPETLRALERTIDEYLDRFCPSKITKREAEELRELVMDLLEEELKSVPRIKRFRSSVKETSCVFECMFEIVEAIGYRSSLHENSEEESVLYHLIGKIILGLSYAARLRSATAH